LRAATHHHLALVVDEVERSLRFYAEAIGAEVLARPFAVTAPEVATALELPAGTAIEMAIVGVPPGGMIELIRFTGEQVPEWVGARPGLVPHVGFRVGDVAATLALVERHGGARVWPEVVERPSGRMVYVRDPDGNVIELVDMSVDAMVAEVHADFPAARP
jgi:catechol 2,3-dioxygenase-like lactoylglutathione lyase family enzyme